MSYASIEVVKQKSTCLYLNTKKNKFTTTYCLSDNNLNYTSNSKELSLINDISIFQGNFTIDILVKLITSPQKQLKVLNIKTSIAKYNKNPVIITENTNNNLLTNNIQPIVNNYNIQINATFNQNNFLSKINKSKEK